MPYPTPAACPDQTKKSIKKIFSSKIDPNGAAGRIYKKLYGPAEIALNIAMVHTPTPRTGPRGNHGAAPKEPGVSFDEMLVAIGKRRDRQSFMELFQYFAPRIKSYLMKGGVSEAQADELAQETMLTIWQKAESFNPAQAKASTWIYTIARNKRIDALRKVKYAEVDQDDPLYTIEDDRMGADETLAHAEEEAALEALIGALPDDQAFLIRKSFYEDKSHAAIAAETGIALGTVKSRIRMALEKLRGEKKAQALWQ